MNQPTTSDTPRTEAECIQIYQEDVTECSSAIEYVPASVAHTLERELAEATAEASHYMAVAQKATDELIFFRADNLKAHQMTCVAGLERDRLRAEVERLNEQCETNKRSISNAHTAIDESGILPPRDKTHQGLTPRVKSIIARAEKAEAALAEAKLERETIAQSSLRSLEAYMDKLKQFAERAERAEAEIAEWSVLNLWGGTPDFIHEFIKGQQARIHRCQDLEADNAKWQKLLLMSRDDREIDLISEIEEQARLLGMSGEREADLLGKLGRLESELAAIKHGHGELGKYEQLRLKNAELQRDKARLDWLESPAGFDWQWNSAHSVLVRRAAIDAAMKGTP
jgi:hypothetical protein